MQTQMVQVSAFASSIRCQYESTMQYSYNESGNTSSPYAELGAIVTRVNDGYRLNKQCLIPLPLAKLAKKNDRATVDSSSYIGRLLPLSWMVLCSSMLLVPSFWMIKFSNAVLLERKEELMIVISNGYEDYALTVKGETFVWKV